MLSNILLNIHKVTVRGAAQSVAAACCSINDTQLFQTNTQTDFNPRRKQGGGADPCLGAPGLKSIPAWDRQRPDGRWERARLDLRVEGGPGAALRYADVVATHPVTGDAGDTTGNARLDGRQAAHWERKKQQRYSLERLILDK